MGSETKTIIAGEERAWRNIDRGEVLSVIDEINVIGRTNIARLNRYIKSIVVTPFAAAHKITG